tara:strand:- start:253 stop:459 length:207 start_codon:yes stop_codon:yes gene_type:complete
MTNTSKEFKEAQEAVNKLRSSVSRLVDDMHGVKSELANFKQNVTSDIQRLVELREKDIDQIRKQFEKK